MNYYNEHDPFAAEWLRSLIRARLIPPGEVDQRDIQEVQADDVRRFTQCHFFAGIGGWSYALQLAGWQTTRPVWTGSCPCQPFSAAGERKGIADERHVWPDFCRLIAECRPAIVFGEQVASKLGRGWLDGVSADLEALEYAVGSADLCAAGVGSPHIRQRLWWVADSASLPSAEHEHDAGERSGSRQDHAAVDSGASGRVANAENHNGGRGERGQEAGIGTDGERGRRLASGGIASRLANSTDRGRRARLGHDDARQSDAQGLRGLGDASEPGLPLSEHADLCGAGRGSEGRAVEQPSVPLGPWSSFVLAHCRDGKARRLEPGVAPLAHGLPNRVGRLRGYGNAIRPQVAATFIKAYCEARGQIA